MNKNIQNTDQCSWGSVAKNKEMRSAVRDWIVAEGADYFVTAVFNRETNFAGAQNNLRHWHARIDRCLLGKRWQKKEEQERTFFWAFAEHPDSNLHYHLMVKLSDPAKRTKFEANAKACWQKIVNSGDMEFRYLATNSDLIDRAGYSTKGLWRSDLHENYIISSMFLSEKGGKAEAASNAPE